MTETKTMNKDREHWYYNAFSIRYDEDFKCLIIKPLAEDRTIKMTIKKLLEYVPGFFPCCSQCKKPINTYDVTEKELQQDSQAPFFSEAYLYNLLGKEEARSLLAIIDRLT